MSEEEIVRMYLSIPPDRRKYIAVQLQRQKGKQRNYLLYAVIKEMSDMMGGELDLQSRKRPDVEARMVVSYFLHKVGFSEAEIGTALGKDHSMIHKYVDDMRFFLERDFYPSIVKMYNDFKTKIESNEIYRGTISSSLQV